MTRKSLRFLSLVFLFLALGLVAYNLYEGQRAYAYSKEIMEEIQALNLEEKPLPSEENDFSIPVVRVDGLDIIGYLEIPKLDKVLPVTADWDYDLMKKYPNRYVGDTYGDPLIIMAHNYRKHFSDIHKLETGDLISFVDGLGRVTDYEVQIREVIDGHDVDSMVNTDYDLSLFTCTLDRVSRFTIRANRL